MNLLRGTAPARAGGDARARAAGRVAGAQARLSALRFQLNPHFRSNARTRCLRWCGARNAEGQRMLSRWPTPRLTLEDSRPRGVNLADESSTSAPTCEIEKVRFGERLRVDHDVPDDALLAELPPLSCRRWWRTRSSTASPPPRGRHLRDLAQLAGAASAWPCAPTRPGLTSDSSAGVGWRTCCRAPWRSSKAPAPSSGLERGELGGLRPSSQPPYRPLSGQNCR